MQTTEIGETKKETRNLKATETNITTGKKKETIVTEKKKIEIKIRKKITESRRKRRKTSLDADEEVPLPLIVEAATVLIVILHPVVKIENTNEGAGHNVLLSYINTKLTSYKQLSISISYLKYIDNK